MSEANVYIKQAIQIYKAGDKAKAKALLLKAVDIDDRNENAWMWMSTVVDSLEEQQICLANVLDINPNNERAQKGLAIINQKLGKPAAPPSPPPPVVPSFDDWSQPAAPAATGFDDWSQPAAPSTPTADVIPSSVDWGGSGAPAYGSGQTGDTTSPEQYDDWISNLGIGGKSEPAAAPSADPWANSATPFSADEIAENPWNSPEGTAQPAAAPPPAVSADPWGSAPSNPWGESIPSNPFEVQVSSAPAWGHTDNVAPFPEPVNDDPWGSVGSADDWSSVSEVPAPTASFSTAAFDAPAPTADWGQVDDIDEMEAEDAEEYSPSQKSPDEGYGSYTPKPIPEPDDDLMDVKDFSTLKFDFKDYDDNPFAGQDFSDFDDPFEDDLPPGASEFYRYIPTNLRSKPKVPLGLKLRVVALGVLNVAALIGAIMALA